VRADSGEIFDAQFALWVETESGLVHPGQLVPGRNEPGDILLEAFGEFVEQTCEGICPDKIEVKDPALAEYLREHLPAVGIEVRLVDRLVALQPALHSLLDYVGAQAAKPPSLVAARGMTVEHVRSFADAAAAFYRAAPWRYMTDSDLIRVEVPKPPRGMGLLVVLGAGRSSFGLVVYPSLAAYCRFLRIGTSGDSAGSPLGGLTQVLFDELADLPESDAELWQQHELPVAGPRSYPLAIKYQSKGDLSRPSPKELEFLAGALRALAATSEEEIDSGRWHKDVLVHNRFSQFTLAMPDLLDPPAPQEWLQRGFEPDRRAHERVFADMQRYLRDHPPASEADLEALNKVFAGRSLDEPATQPRSPAERAQDLCFQAFDVRGRRRVQLARQALELDPDCADAYVILAEQAGTLDDELRQYAAGVHAGERALGAEALAQDAGDFWANSETRPYMRSRLGLAEALVRAGRGDEAIEHYQELLRLNPNDNQGVRYTLLPQLLRTGRDVEAARLLKQYDEESANWAYAQALLAFRLSGPSAAAKRELHRALRINRHVPELLASGGAIPTPPHYAIGSIEEAFCCAVELRAAYRATAGAVEWILAESREVNDVDRRPAAGRRGAKKRGRK
jgi:tetratricopeptide (TPR) repeat protein